MSFVKRGDSQPVLHIIKESDDELEEKRKKAEAEAKRTGKNIDSAGNKNESKTESDNN